MVIPDSASGSDPSHWSELLRYQGVTVWNSVPALVSLLISHEQGHRKLRTSGLRLVLLSGDWIPLAARDQIRALWPPRVIGLGGATEASVWSIYREIRVGAPWTAFATKSRNSLCHPPKSSCVTSLHTSSNRVVPNVLTSLYSTRWFSTFRIATI
jgi:acyl-coenzyme A synthetase/AMP-(fatty) acid ligase